MRDNHFPHPVSHRLSQQRREPVHVAVQPQIPRHQPPVCLEPAVHVVQLHPARPPDHEVKDAGRRHLPDRILAILLPSRYQVVAFVQFFKKAWNLFRIVLQVAVHRKHNVAPAKSESGSQRRGLSEVSLETNHVGRFVAAPLGGNEFQANSFTIKEGHHITKVPGTTTDLFLYGHSTLRQWDPSVAGRAGQTSRGISIGHHYVSAAKVARYIDFVAGSNFRAAGDGRKLRIWLLSCHTGGTGTYATYALHLAEKLAVLGWRDKRLIAFKNAVTTKTLKRCREFAAATKLYAPIDSGNLPKGPVLISIDEAGGCAYTDKSPSINGAV